MLLHSDNDHWPDDMIRLLREQRRQTLEPTATEVAAYVGMRLAEYGAYALIAICLALTWIGTP